MNRAGWIWLMTFWLGATSGMPAPADPEFQRAFDSERVAEMGVAITDAIQLKQCPGAVLWIERDGVSYSHAFGQRALFPAGEPMTDDTLFDAASLTKVLATAPAILWLAEHGRLSVEHPVSRYLPGFTGQGRELITLRHLLTHTSGLRAGLSRDPLWNGYEEGIRRAVLERPDPRPGALFRYSDINFILLGEVVRIVSGEPLDQFVARELYLPLKMSHTRFRPDPSQRDLIAPTEKVGDEILRGRVHDPTSRLMGGVTGHAGLFSTAGDIARFARMMLRGGELEGVRVFKEQTVRLMTSVQTSNDLPARRGLGWDIDSGYSRPRGRKFPLGSYGHTGFTGTCLWIDPFSKSFWILLSNRVHPDGKGNILSLQADLGTLAAQSMRGVDWMDVPGALPPKFPATNSWSTPSSTGVLNGIDVLVRDRFKPLRGRRLGLITNHTGQDRNRRSTLDLLARAPEVQLKALFSPEHGIRGVADSQVDDSRDELTGLPVFSLYGERRAPSTEQLRDLDALVFDIQDIGVRFYTYIATLAHCMEAAATAGLDFYVLDRINPINGVRVEGPVHTNTPTFIACHPLPLRHSMTVGELAKLFLLERGWKLSLTVIQVEGWKRSRWFDESELPWTSPSPNMRSMEAALLYPGLGFLESALSVGRGTDTPFQRVGAPYIDDVAFAREMNRAALPGVRFTPIQFRPTYSTFKDRQCGGAALFVTDREAMAAVDVGIEIARVLQRMYPSEFALEKLRPLLTDGPTLDAIKTGQPLAEIKSGWAKGLQQFQSRRTRVLLYHD